MFEAPEGKGALMVLPAVLLCVDGTCMVDKYLTASGLAHVGCSLRKESSSGDAMGVLQMGWKQLDRRDFFQHNL